MLSCFSHVCCFLTLTSGSPGSFCPWISPNTGVGFAMLSRGIFLDQGPNYISCISCIVDKFFTHRVTLGGPWSKAFPCKFPVLVYCFIWILCSFYLLLCSLCNVLSMLYSVQWFSAAFSIITEIFNAYPSAGLYHAGGPQDQVRAIRVNSRATVVEQWLRKLMSKARCWSNTYHTPQKVGRAWASRRGVGAGR